MDSSGQLYVVLVHGPVCGKAGEETTTSITPIDLTDLARSCRTFGAHLVVVQPDHNQRALAHRLLDHWRQREGDHPDRSAAMEEVRVVASLAGLMDETRIDLVIATSAIRVTGLETSSFGLLREKISGKRIALLFGTGHGLTGKTLCEADRILEPICGAGNYNHLSVRSAVAICLDRLWGR